MSWIAGLPDLQTCTIIQIPNSSSIPATVHIHSIINLLEQITWRSNNKSWSHKLSSRNQFTTKAIPFSPTFFFTIWTTIMNNYILRRPNLLTTKKWEISVILLSLNVTYLVLWVGIFHFSLCGCACLVVWSGCAVWTYAAGAPLPISHIMALYLGACIARCAIASQ